MVLRMANPQKNKHGVYMYTVRVPTDLVEVVGKRVYSISLRTKDPTEARQRFLAMATQKDLEHKALRATPEAIPYASLVTMAGEVYREQRAHAEAAAGPNELGMIFEGLCARATDDAWLADIAGAKLKERGLAGDENSQRLLVQEVAKAFTLLAREVSKMEGGDYSPDPNLSRFSALSPSLLPGKKGPSINDLYDLWKRDHTAHGKGKKTADDYLSIVKKFKAWLKHNDAAMVTRGNIKAYCDHLVHDGGLSTKTVNGRYLTCIKAIFRVGYERELIPENPAATVRQKVTLKPLARSKSFTDDEARAILALANSAFLPPADGSRDKRSLYNKRVARWVPWVLCYTGARVAEITQLRKEDVTERDGIPCIRITPDAGSVKTGQYRDVPIHPHLVDMGFLDFVGTCADGPIFYDPTMKRKGKGMPPAQWAGNALGRWLAKELGDDMPDASPNHAWRHRFKTVGRVAGIALEYIDAIQGHSNKNVSATYGEMPLAALHREMQKVPRLVID